ERYTTRGIRAAFWACTAIGQTNAAPPMRPMNSRRFIRSPRETTELNRAYRTLARRMQNLPYCADDVTLLASLWRRHYWCDECLRRVNLSVGRQVSNVCQ